MAQVSGCLPEDRAAPKQTTSAQTRLFVGDLSSSTTEEQLYNYFRKFGALQEVLIPESMKGKPKMFAYVQFESSEAAQTALAATKSIPFESGKFLRTELAIPLETRHLQSQNSGRSKVILTGIPKGTKMQELIRRVSAFGTLLKITKYRLFKSKLSGCRVHFDSAASAQELLSQGHLILESGATIEVRSNLLRSCRQPTGETHEKTSHRSDHFGNFPVIVGEEPYFGVTLQIRKSLWISNIPKQELKQQNSIQPDPVGEFCSKHPSKAENSGQVSQTNRSRPLSDKRPDNLRFNLRVCTKSNQFVPAAI